MDILFRLFLMQKYIFHKVNHPLGRSIFKTCFISAQSTACLSFKTTNWSFILRICQLPPLAWSIFFTWRQLQLADQHRNESVITFLIIACVASGFWGCCRGGTNVTDIFFFFLVVNCSPPTGYGSTTEPVINSSFIISN